ncbi:MULTISPECIES: hypothetical protein [Paraburkholderia]|uniref:Uncharacterized protein n=1 Tax=Paraburkholderia unamae TaxID=219649 RepID=A0ACC6RJC9_9BURK
MTQTVAPLSIRAPAPRLHARIGEDDLGQMSLATGESFACLNYLMYRGEVKRELRDDGMYWYSRT